MISVSMVLQLSFGILIGYSMNIFVLGICVYKFITIQQTGSCSCSMNKYVIGMVHMIMVQIIKIKHSRNNSVVGNTHLNLL